MATTDAELISEARVMTGYTDGSVISDSDFQDLVNVCKEELRDDFGVSDYSFFSGDLSADRALFWFLCIAAKIHTGEIGGMNISTGDVEAQNPGHIHHDATWFSNYEDKKRKAERVITGSSGPAQSAPQRDGRTYGDQ